MSHEAEASFHHFLSEARYYLNHEEWGAQTRKYFNDFFINTYQDKAYSYCLPEAKTLAYLIPGLAAEAGEVAGKWAKYIRDGGAQPVNDIIKEVGDVMWFCAVIALHYGKPLSTVMQENLDKLEGRAARNTIRGSGDER